MDLAGGSDANAAASDLSSTTFTSKAPTQRATRGERSFEGIEVLCMCGKSDFYMI